MNTKRLLNEVRSLLNEAPLIYSADSTNYVVAITKDKVADNVTNYSMYIGNALPFDVCNNLPASKARDFEVDIKQAVRKIIDAYSPKDANDYYDDEDTPASSPV